MYVYEELKPKILLGDNQRMFLGIRDQVARILETSGVVTMGKAIALPPGIGAADCWTLMACVDRLVELDELEEIPASGRGQDRIFRKGRR